MNKIEQMHLDAINNCKNEVAFNIFGTMISKVDECLAATEVSKVTEQVSIRFAEWIGLFGWNYNASNNCWWNISDIDYFPTTKELFQEFLKTKQ